MVKHNHIHGTSSTSRDIIHKMAHHLGETIFPEYIYVLLNLTTSIAKYCHFLIIALHG